CAITTGRSLLDYW
nr:immunoglobulin heavy chain junction region [Macaca mulatta]